MMFPILILVWVAILLAGSKIVEFLWVRALGIRPFRIFVAPGIIVHEYSHALACILTRTKIHEIALFKKEGGHVKHNKPAGFLPFMKQFFISFAPVLGCLLAIWVVMLIFGKGVVKDTPAPAAETDTTAGAPADATPPPTESEAIAADAPEGGDVKSPTASAEMEAESDALVDQADKGDVGGVISAFISAIGKALVSLAEPVKAGVLIGILYLWLLLSFTVSMSPSERDFLNSVIGIVVVIALIIGAGFALKAMDSQDTVLSIFKGLSGMIAYTSAVMLAAIGLSVVVAIPIAGIRYKMMRSALR